MLYFKPTGHTHFLTHLFVGAGFQQRIPSLQFALQHAVISIFLFDLFPVRVHLHHQLGVSLLQAGARRVRALHLRLHLGQLVQQPPVFSGHAPVVKRHNDDNHQKRDQDERREATTASIRAEPDHCVIEEKPRLRSPALRER